MQLVSKLYIFPRQGKFASAQIRWVKKNHFTQELHTKLFHVRNKNQQPPTSKTFYFGTYILNVELSGLTIWSLGSNTGFKSTETALVLQELIFTDSSKNVLMNRHSNGRLLCFVFKCLPLKMTRYDTFFHLNA